MKRPFIIWICAGFAITAQCSTVSATLEKARNARAEGLGVSAIHSLRAALDSAEGADRSAVALELARCLIDGDREREAITLLENDEFEGNSEAQFWLAQALAQAGENERALEIYTRVTQDRTFEGLADAEYGRARMLDVLGRSQQALQAYEAIPPESRRYESARLGAAAILAERGRSERALKFLEDATGSSRRDREIQRYLTGRVLLETGDYEGVRTQYDGFEPRNRKLAAGAVIGDADALARTGRPADAEKRLEAFVWANPRTPMLPEVMAKLDEVRAMQREPSNATLKLWEKSPHNPQLAALATYYLARSDEREGRTERAIRTYREYLEARPGGVNRFEAMVRLARLHLSRGEIKEAERVLEGAETIAGDRRNRAALRFLRAALRFESGSPGDATKLFVQAAEMDPAISEAALSNAALSAIRSGNEPLAAEVMNALFKEHPETAQRIELAQAFQSAAQGNPDAGEQLAWIADQAGEQGRAARFASAEWRWMHGDIPGARAELLRVANTPGEAPGSAQADYFSVYLADDGTIDAVDRVSAAAKEFLARNPDSANEAAVRMKWGEVLSRAGDHAGARAQFELAAASADDPKVAAEASFLAGRAANRSMDASQFEQAIVLFERVAEIGEPVLAEQARLEQAALRNALGQPAEAVKLLDSLIAATKNERLRVAAGLMKARTLIESEQPADVSAAIETLRAIADGESALPAERNEALVRLAGAYEKKGDFDGTLAAYYEVLNAPRDSQPEFYWYYRAGFEAARLLHEREMLKEEAAVLEKMASVKGPRAAEAAEAVKRLRLENFIWED
jgi:hypothetical protein